jgi:hypothetical protein
LKVFPDDSHGNSSASLSITLKEQQWSSDMSADPISWVVSSVSITKGGSGYSVGQFMFVDFDPAWMEPRKKLTGQYIFPFPRTDDCGYPLTWEDDYGFRQIGGVVPIQRIRISSVDNNGKITGVELVPWYKQPEVVAGSCIDFIQDKADNTTRFFVLGRKAAGSVGGGKDVTSLLVSLGDEAASHSGALLKMLMPLAERGVNLSKIESRPSKKRPWDYFFFLDVSGHYEDAAMKAALAELRASCPMVKWLGSYPSAT